MSRGDDCLYLCLRLLERELLTRWKLLLHLYLRVQLGGLLNVYGNLVRRGSRARVRLRQGGWLIYVYGYECRGPGILGQIGDD